MDSLQTVYFCQWLSKRKDLYLYSFAANIEFCSLELQKRSKEVAHKIATDEAVLRRSTRVRAPPRKYNPAVAFLRYVNKWKED